MKILFRPQSGKLSRLFSCCNIRETELTQSLKHEIDRYWSANLKPAKFAAASENDKYYVLSMFPYPSGKLHMGHVRVYTISDTMARYYRMHGKNVIHPIGWDAFGLPAENAAIQHGIEPHSWTEQNIAKMRGQLKKLNCSFDWDREISTCDPNYYKWTQFLFVRLFRNGLAYRKKALVNWDPVDRTVLADEQVDETGRSWRSGARVEKKFLTQWFVRTTKYMAELLDGLNDSCLHDWRDVLKIQKHWIGDCNGVTFDFDIIHDRNETDHQVTVWLADPEQILNLDYIVLSASHDLVESLGTNCNLHALNPFNKRKIRIFIDAMPDNDAKQKMYLGFVDERTEYARKICEKYRLKPRPKFYFRNQQESLKIRHEVMKKAELLNIGGYWTSKNLRDWLISRQRYWGTPIPIVYCEKCGTVPVPEQDLPVKLPTKNEREEWARCRCPECGAEARRETDTMDTFVDSSWYFVRYLDPENRTELASRHVVDKFYPVDLYVGGKEHACLHMFFARFMSYFMYKEGLVAHKEPFRRLLVQGMVRGQCYQHATSGKYLTKDEVDFDVETKEYFEKGTNAKVVCSWEKMSKSKANGVDPDSVFDEYGIDTSRLFVMANVAPMSARNWSSETFAGIINWQNRLWLTVQTFLNARENLPPAVVVDDHKLQHYDNLMFDSRNFYIRSATFNFEVTQQISVAISKLQGLTNDLRKVPVEYWPFSRQFERALAVQIIMLAPLTPYFASELWSHFVSAPNRLSGDRPDDICWTSSVLEQKWPTLDPDYTLKVSPKPKRKKS